MNILAEAESNAAISILHALGLDKGCSIGINLKAKVKLVSEPQEIKNDFHQLFQSIEMVWKENGFPLPDEYGWQVSSEIPIGQGLKSSSAISCAAIKALNEATWAGLNESEIVEIVATISLFGFLNRWNDTMATELEELPEKVAKSTIKDTFGWDIGKHEQG